MPFYFYPFSGEGFPKIDHRKKGALILTSPLALELGWWAWDGLGYEWVGDLKTNSISGEITSAKVPHSNLPKRSRLRLGKKQTHELRVTYFRFRDGPNPSLKLSHCFRPWASSVGHF